MKSDGVTTVPLAAAQSSFARTRGRSPALSNASPPSPPRVSPP